MTERATDVLVVGGGTGGVAAALACARMGVRCIITEPTSLLGGQFTAQAVPPDENQWVEATGASSSYQELRERVRESYRRNPHVIAGRRTEKTLNPGGGWVSRLCATPVDWRDAISAMLAPFTAPREGGPLLTIHHGLTPTGIETNSDRITAVHFAGATTGQATVIRAAFVLDATELGDLLELGGVEHDIGAEHQGVYGESHGRTDFDAAQRTDPLDQQACSWCFGIEHCPGEDHRQAAPPGYDAWKAFIPRTTPPWCGPLFSWTVPSHNVEGHRTFRMVPWPAEPHPGEWEMWRYRRIVDSSLYLPEHRSQHPDVTLINMVQMDFWNAPLLGVSATQQSEALEGAKQLSRCLLYWMQTDAPRHDGGTGYPGLRLRPTEMASPDGFALAAYIREPRRLRALTIVTEAHIGTDQRKAAGLDRSLPNWDKTPFGVAEPFADTVGIGHYMIDLHPSCSGRNSVYVPAAPFRIPMGSLIPQRVTNLLAAGKCLGVTHITNGCYRMHHVEWGIGEAAGTLAAYCVHHATTPHSVHGRAERVREVQSALTNAGVRIAWPWE